MLLRALVHKPALLIAKEPWLGIEEQYRLEIQQMLLQLEDTTVIMATNDRTFSLQCDNCIDLEKTSPENNLL
jgi:ABC-type lipoprotein export system ATPase subunit